ncbi:MAG: iron-containing alcohol dehydrogenase [Chloroflexota bacterium]
MEKVTPFDFQTAGRILFGSGVVARLPQLAHDYGKRIFLIGGVVSSILDEVVAGLKAEGMTVVQRAVREEPTLNGILAFAEEARKIDSQVIVGLGGGSALDAAKATAALTVNPGDPLDYLEVIGKGLPLRVDPLPVIAIPTTAGTGSEVTRNAVLGIPERKVKVSLRSPKMLPVIALVDAELTLSLSAELTASTGMDALTQLIEPYVSNRANALTDQFCEAGIQCSVRSLRAAYRDGNNLTAREELSFASLMGGLALANAGLGAAHGFAAPIGGLFGAPHGAVCARLLPAVCRANIRAIQKQDTAQRILDRYTQVAVWLTGRHNAIPFDGAEWLDELCAEINIPPLREYGIQHGDFAWLIENAAKASSMKANPVILAPDELAQILEDAW